MHIPDGALSPLSAAYTVQTAAMTDEEVAATQEKLNDLAGAPPRPMCAAELGAAVVPARLTCLLLPLSVDDEELALDLGKKKKKKKKEVTADTSAVSACSRV